MTSAIVLSDAFSAYREKRLPMEEPSTIRQFTINLQRFSDYLGHTATADDLSDDNVRRVMIGMIRKDGLAARTANKFRDNILALWRFLCRRGDLTRWPEVSALPEPERDPIAWSREQLATLWRACDSQDGVFDRVPKRLWWIGIHSVGWDLAERVGGLLSIRRDDCDLASRWITVRAEGRKGKRQDKSGRIHPDTAMVLKQMWEPTRELLFPLPYTREYLWVLYGKLLDEAGLPSDRRHKFHCLRKSSASWYEAAGGNAQRLLGHKDGRVTQKYLDPRIVDTQHAAELLFRPQR